MALIRHPTLQPHCMSMNLRHLSNKKAGRTYSKRRISSHEIWDVSPYLGNLAGVPVIRIIVFGGSILGSPYSSKYLMIFTVDVSDWNNAWDTLIESLT